MSLTGDMPLVGGKRFGIRPESDKAIRIDMGRVMDSLAYVVRDYPFPGFPVQTLKVQGGSCGVAQNTTPLRAPVVPFMSATGNLLAVGDYIRGSDKTSNNIVNRNFRGRILEFLTPTPAGNNVRVKCAVTGKVYRVKNREIRSAK